MTYNAGNYDVAVRGGGHAGVEAGLVSARLGCSTVMFTINLDWIGNMPCNPSIGGTAKGNLVCELDALGGQMGKTADKTTLQSRVLNRGKGPAVHNLRTQIDRRAYSTVMKHTVEKQEKLDVKQAEIVDLKKTADGWQLITALDAAYTAKAVIIATGTFLGGKIFVGEHNYDGGPDGMFAATKLGTVLKDMGLQLRRFKTGTPARVDRASIDFSKLEIQQGDEDTQPFSYSTEHKIENKVVCHIGYTNEKTKQIIKANLHRSPLFAGEIEGVGPRYCPSIEDKIVRFADKQRHQFFVEPCGLDTEEMYLQGMSSSLPEEVQVALYRSIEGLENVKIMRSAYAIEYDCVDPQTLSATLELKDFENLYGAGQFNGSSGYEEAAVQGFVAGANAALKLQGKKPLILSRSNSYIGTLIDDLVTKGCMDPYRMMTSRSEYRLVLRQDNADERLMPIGRELGLIDDKVWERFCDIKTKKEKEIERLEVVTVGPTAEINAYLESIGSAPLSTGAKLADLLRRPGVTYEGLLPFNKQAPELDNITIQKIETEVKYEGYINRQLAQIKEQQRLEEKIIPDDVDYSAIGNLRLEAIEKLNKVRPRSIGQASRISGVSPADISVLLIKLEKDRRQNNE